MSVFNLKDYKQYLLSIIVCKAIYKKIDITELLIDSLCQFTLAPSTFLYQIPQITVSRKHRQMFNLIDKPTSVQTNDWLLYKFGYKYCTGCSNVRHVTLYKKDAGKWNRLQHLCADCANKQNKNYRINNPEAHKIYELCNAEKIKQKRKIYIENNSVKLKTLYRRYYLANQEKIKKYGTQHRLANLDKYAARSAKYRASKLKATPPWLTVNQLLEIKQFYSKAKSKEQETGIKYHVDHIVPLQGVNVCGLHVPWNLQILSATENMQKHNKLLITGEINMSYDS